MTKIAFLLVALLASRHVVTFSLAAAFSPNKATTRTTTQPAAAVAFSRSTVRRAGNNRSCNKNNGCKQQQQLQHGATRRVVVLHMGSSWGPDPVWSAATVTSVSDACPSGKSASAAVTVPPETAAAYTVPGQYVQVRLPPSSDSDDATKPAILAICSAPSAENAAAFEFLIKKTDSNAWLTGVAADTALQVSQVMGGGFNMAENLEGFKYDFPTQNVLLFAAGSGIAPIAAAIESGLLMGPSSRTCRLYYGERTAADLCFVERFARWEELGVQVVPVLSQPADDWKGRCGYIQTALAEDGIAVPRNTGALLCGMRGMTEAVKELLLAAGVFEGRVLFNF